MDAIGLMHHMLTVKFVITDMHCLQTKPVTIAQKMMQIVLTVLLIVQIIINAWSANLDLVPVHLVADVNHADLKMQNNVKFLQTK